MQMPSATVGCFVLAIALGGAVTSFAQPPARGEALRRADADGDGRVSFDEAQRAFPDLTRAQFDQRDRNGDGFLSRADTDQAQRPRQEPNPMAIFRQADTNGDRNVTFEELTRVAPQFERRRFNQMDTNRDGAIQPAELRAAAQRGQRRPAAGGDEEDGRITVLATRFRKADTNGDGKTTYEEIIAARPGFPHENFDRYDRNKDGVISEDDFRGAG